MYFRFCVYSEEYKISKEEFNKLMLSQIAFRENNNYAKCDCRKIKITTPNDNSVNDNFEK